MPLQRPRSQRGFSTLRIAGWLTAIITCVPVISIVLIALTRTDDTFAHTFSVVLPAAMAETLWLLFGVAILSCSMGTVTAWLVTAYEFPGRRLLSWLLVLPLAIPTYIAAYIAVELFEPLGPVQSAFRFVSGFASARDYWFPPVRSLPAAIVIFSLVLYPYIYLSTRAMLMTQSASPLDAARILGAAPARVASTIALPLARPAIAAGLTLALLETLNDIGASEYLGVRTLALGIYTTWLNRHSLPGGAQIACVLLACVAMLLCVEIYVRGLRSYVNSARASSPMRARALHGAQAWAASIACGLPVFFGFILPASFLAYRTVKNIQREGLPDGLASQLTATLLFAVCATLLIVICGLCVALAVRHRRSTANHMMTQAASIGYAVPGTVLALGLLWPLASLDQMLTAFFARGSLQPFIGTGAAVVIAMTIRFLSIGVQGAANGLTRIPRSMEESAKLLGASPREIFFRLQWPLLKPALGAAALIAFIDSAKELPATLLLRPLGVETLSTALYAHAARGQFEDGTLHALLIVLIGVAAALLVAAAPSARKQELPA